MKGRALALPIAALVAVIALLGVQLAFGGASYEPAKIADPCVQKPLPAATTDLEQVTQTVVLLGVQNAACTLGVSRESLVLALPSAADRSALAQQAGVSDQQVSAALKDGMSKAVERMDAEQRLPPASSLLDSYAGELGLSPMVTSAIQKLPPSLVDGFLPTGDVLQRAIQELDVDALLSNLQNPDALEPAIRDAIKAAALEEAKAKINEQLSGGLGGLFGLGG
jgi:hypothetical protein